MYWVPSNHSPIFPDWIHLTPVARGKNVSGDPDLKALSGDPSHQHLYVRVGVNLVLLIRVELHSLGLGSWPLPLGLGSGLATVYINNVSA